MTEEQLNLIWKQALSEIEGEISPAVFKTWFHGAQLTALTPGSAQVTVENIHSKGFIHKYAEGKILASISQQAGYEVTTIEYIIVAKPKVGRKNAPAGGQSLFNSVDDSEPVSPSQAAQQRSSDPIPESNLNPKYRFDTFIIGNRNRLAHAAAKAVAERPGKMYNPLYLYGGVGLGKTHLMQAVGNEIIAREPQKRVVYVSSESLMNEYVAGIRGNKMDAFKKKYRNVDVFLIDDIQFIAGKDGIQEEFFHTFNSLYQTDKQIIITSDKAPSEIADLEERLSSRFSSGMIADMQLPDQETRQAILQAKCEEKGISLPDQVIFYIADLVETNIRELEGALTTVLVHLASSDTPPSLEEVRDMLRAFSLHKPLKKTTFEQIKEIVCEYYGVDFKDVQGPRRQQEIVKPRQILMYLMKNELGMTFPTIGREIGGRDHTTAMHSVDKIEKEMKKSPDLLDELSRIKELFYVGGHKP
ncbi:MAG: chromosomal replication initiator protein DnaA [bacterium]